MSNSRSVLLTGGAGDIGTAIAIELAARGHRISVLDAITQSDASPALKSIERVGNHPVTYFQADVRDREAIDEAVAAIETLDIAIGCAAIAASHPFLEISPETWSETLDTNLTGCFNLGQAAARAMKEQLRAGLILFIGSWVQRIPWPDITAYTVSKAGVEMLARQMARELARSEIRVNVVAPGIVDAGLAKQQRMDDPKYAEQIGKVIPVGTLQTVEQVAKVTAFLCTDDANYLTGMTLLADGGASLFQFDQT